MKLIPLVDRFGTVRAWADRKSGLVSNPAGNALALIEFDAVFRFSGSQIGWWFGDHIRDPIWPSSVGSTKRKNRRISSAATTRGSRTSQDIFAFRPSGVAVAAAAADEAACMGKS